jgi:hypothetical protein
MASPLKPVLKCDNRWINTWKLDNNNLESMSSIFCFHLSRFPVLFHDLTPPYDICSPSSPQNLPWSWPQENLASQIWTESITFRLCDGSISQCCHRL